MSKLATIARTGEKATEVGLKSDAVAQDLLNAAGISLRKGEVLEREGEVIDLETSIENGDVVFVTEDDTNGGR